MKKPNACQYFLGCKEIAVTTIPHPILKSVKVCQKCKDFYDRVDKKS